MQQIDNFIKEIDFEIGRQIYNARVKSGLRQKDIASSINVSVQQLIKYEKGINKISLARLILLSRKLNKNLSEFYIDLAP